MVGEANSARTAAALAVGLLLCAIAAPATWAAPSPLLDQDAVVAPESTTARPPPPDDPPASTTTNPTPAPGPQTTTATTAATPQPPAPPPAAPEILRNDPGAGNAAAQSAGSKRREASAACSSQRPPINEMLAIGGIVASDEASPWARLALFVAACFAVVGAIAFLVRRRAARRTDAPVAARGRLETASTLVAIIGTLIAIGDQLVTDSPPPEAVMTVRDVLPRITRGEYARRTGSEVRRIPRIDRREVGNVVLLEIRLSGYEGRRLDLQYATYSLDHNVSGTLLHGTDRTVGLRVADELQTSFVPIWVGYPKSARFEAQFRLIENAQIRQLTNAGPMRGSAYRYACSRDTRAL